MRGAAADRKFVAMRTQPATTLGRLGAWAADHRRLVVLVWGVAVLALGVYATGVLSTLPDPKKVIEDVAEALGAWTYAVVAVELLRIAWIRRRLMQVSLTRSLIQVTLGGVTVATVGVIIGSAA